MHSGQPHRSLEVGPSHTGHGINSCGQVIPALGNRVKGDYSVRIKTETSVPSSGLYTAYSRGILAVYSDNHNDQV